MLDRRKKEKEEEEAKSRNFGFIPGTTLHSSYVNKSYDQGSNSDLLILSVSTGYCLFVTAVVYSCPLQLPAV